MNIQDNPVYQQHKNLLFATDQQEVNLCCHLFGSLIFFQGKLRKEYVLSGDLKISLLQKNNFGLLDALGDDGTLTTFMMNHGISFSTITSEGPIFLPKPHLSKPVTIGQIQAWVKHDPSLLHSKVAWTPLSSSSHKRVCFVQYIEELIGEHKVFDMEGHTLSANDSLMQHLKWQQQAFLEQTMLRDELSKNIELKSSLMGRKM